MLMTLFQSSIYQVSEFDHLSSKSNHYKIISWHHHWKEHYAQVQLFTTFCSFKKAFIMYPYCSAKDWPRVNTVQVNGHQVGIKRLKIQQVVSATNMMNKVPCTNELLLDAFLTILSNYLNLIANTLQLSIKFAPSFVMYFVGKFRCL